MVTWKSTPLDSPLFQMDPERGIEYWGCKAVMATFTVGDDIADLVPHGLHLDTPAFGAVLIADYGASTIGPYAEYVSLLRVVDDDGMAGMYIPYIYVTNDAALTAGREVLGAPKKLAAIGVDVTAQAVVGSLARPADLSAGPDHRGTGRTARSRPPRLPPPTGHALLLAAPPPGASRRDPGPRADPVEL